MAGYGCGFRRRRRHGAVELQQVLSGHKAHARDLLRMLDVSAQDLVAPFTVLRKSGRAAVPTRRAPERRRARNSRHPKTLW